MIRHNNTLRLLIVSDLLDLLTIEAGLTLSTTDLVDLAALCEETALVFETQTPDEVTVSPEALLPKYGLKTSRKRVSQILSNFMSNVMKFTNEGSICIGLHDTGNGILQEKQSNIFEHFVKVNEFS